MKTKEIFQYILAGIIVVFFFATVILLIVIPVPADNQQNLNIVLGALIGVFTAVIGYFFGSSIGSAKKTDLMNEKKLT